MAHSILVAYFSATGTTARVAERLAKAADADLVEIKPTEPYTPADLDWRDKRSRSSVEMNDPHARPKLAVKPKVGRYDTVFIGFPIWWYTAPAIIKTYLEAADFTDKAIALFATSGGSGMGDTLENLVDCAPDAWWLDAERFDANASAAELAAWVQDLEL